MSKIQKGSMSRRSPFQIQPLDWLGASVDQGGKIRVRSGNLGVESALSINKLGGKPWPIP